MDNKCATAGRSFVPLFVTNYFGTLNDNFLKGLASFIVIDWIADPAMKPVFMGVVAGLLVLPFVVCSPLADRLTVVFPKRRVLTLAKAAEFPLVALGILGFVLHSAALVIASVALMGLQSSLYSPSKYALVRDVGGADRISTGMGGMEGIAFLGMLWFFYAPFAPRRKVRLQAEDLTERARDWARGTRLEFNRKLEDWYNADA